jgi:GntR family transcriptional regulator, transcriptional repressor for pyruvate dehydrogenase complex
MTFNTIKRPSVVEEIIESFKEKLISGELKPGDKLPSEAQLMEQFGVGRTALREAIKMLSALGVIDVRQGDGSYIMKGSSATTMSPLVFAVLLESGMNWELLELRTLLETGYCQLAADKATAEDMRMIEEAAFDFEEKVRMDDRDVDDLTKADIKFHFAILNATHNPMVVKISGAVEELFFGSIKKTISQIEGRKWGVDGHRNIIAAIKVNDPEQILGAVKMSLERWSRDLNG